MQRKTDIGIKNNILLFTKHLKLKDKPGKLRPQYVGLFKVLQMVRHNAAKLELERWKGYSLEEDMWVPEVDLEYAHEMLMQYKAKHQL